MSGHSKWANIKRKKAVVDAQKGKDFSKMAREIAVAARQGGGNPDTNFRLKTALEKARAVNLPWDNIQRAIQRGTGTTEGANYEEVIYEGYGPGGVAVMLHILTDNRNRTAADIRHLFSRYKGSLGESGSVAWMFDRVGVVTVSGVDEEELTLQALEAGANDVVAEEDTLQVVTAPETLEEVRRALEGAGVTVSGAEVTYWPKSRVAVTGSEAERLLQLIEALEEHDDVQEVYTNFEISDEELERLSRS